MVIGGFSQGGALAFNIALRYFNEIGGILAMSTFLPIDLTSGNNFLAKFEAGQPLPGLISQHHGDSDTCINIADAQVGAEYLKKVAKSGEFEFIKYRGMDHSSCRQEMKNYS